MAEPNFPQIPSAVWWKLRETFKRTIPAKVTDTYLASILNVQEAAAKQYLRELKIVGLVADDGTPAEIVYDWRDDDKYKAAASKIFSTVYPDELIAIAPQPNPDRKTVVRWFMKVGRMGGRCGGKQSCILCITR